MSFFFFFNDTATTEIYTLSLHDALPISCDTTNFPDNKDARCLLYVALSRAKNRLMLVVSRNSPSPLDRKSTRLNSSHLVISYAVFCLKKKKKQSRPPRDDQHQTTCLRQA